MLAAAVFSVFSIWEHGVVSLILTCAGLLQQGKALPSEESGWIPVLQRAVRSSGALGKIGLVTLCVLVDLDDDRQSLTELWRHPPKFTSPTSFVTPPEEAPHLQCFDALHRYSRQELLEIRTTLSECEEMDET